MDRSQLLCASPSCSFLVHTSPESGGFCPRKCSWGRHRCLRLSAHPPVAGELKEQGHFFNLRGGAAGHTKTPQVNFVFTQVDGSRVLHLFSLLAQHCQHNVQKRILRWRWSSGLKMSDSPDGKCWVQSAYHYTIGLAMLGFVPSAWPLIGSAPLKVGHGLHHEGSPLGRQGGQTQTVSWPSATGVGTLTPLVPATICRHVR